MSKKQPNVRIEKLDDGTGRLRMHYGEPLGYATFNTVGELRASVLPWIARRMVILSTEMRELAAVQRQLVGPKRLDELLDEDEGGKGL
jgi:hypothetical protein